MREFALLVVVALSLCGQSAALGQSNVARAKGVEQALKAKDAERRLKESINGGHYVVQDWTAEGHKISVNLREHVSAEEAARVMEIMGKGIAAAEVVERMKGLWDDAYYTSNRKGTYTSMRLRKGNVLVAIDSASLRLAKEFAKEITDELAR